MIFKKSDSTDKIADQSKFDVKKFFSELLESAEQPRADPRMISALGAVGILLVVVAVVIKAWDGWSGWTTSQAAHAGHEVIQQITQAVAPFEGLYSNPELHALAKNALEDPEQLPAVENWLSDHLGDLASATVYPGTVYEQRPEDMGPNGFALVSMMYIAEKGSSPPLQIHNSLDPPALVQVIAVREGEEIQGFLAIAADPGPVLAAFNPEVGSDSFIALRQDYGRQVNKPLKQVGNPERAPAQPDRLMVPGTMFRVEMPLHQANELLPWGRFFTVIFVGLLMFGASRFLHVKNKRWIAASERERAERKEAEARQAEVAARRREKEDKAREALAAKLAPAEQKDSAGRELSEDKAKEGTAGSSEPPPMRLRYDIAERWKKGVEIPHVELQESIFRAYDIRGEIGKSLDVEIAYQVGQAVGSAALDKDAGPVVVARDGRLSGPQLVEGLVDGIKSTGCDVINIGSVPTGVLYYAVFEKGAGTGVMVTGSHNPPAYNGFKVMVGGETLFGDQITDLYRRIKQGDVRIGRGKVTEENVIQDYCERIASDIQLERPLRAVVDCGNGVGGVCAAQALRGIGAEVLPLFDEVDGTFPNHHPDPSDPENLTDLLDSVKLMGADIGLALDGDADRLGVVTADGEIIYPDRVMILLARDVLERVPGSVIIYDVKCSGHLAREIEEAGGKPVMYKTGHSLIKEKMKEIGSPFAGEMSGHFFFEERWYGVDDGIYSAARLLEILAKSEKTPTEILKALPTGVSTPELKVEMEDGQNHAFIERLQKEAKFPGAQVSTIDGLRADYEDGWGLCRASNTTPVLIVRFDADTEQALNRIKRTFAGQMRGIDPDLALPF